MSLPLLNFLIKKIKKNETINNDNIEQINKITYCSLKFVFDLKYFIYFCSFTNPLNHICKEKKNRQACIVTQFSLI